MIQNSFKIFKILKKNIKWKKSLSRPLRRRKYTILFANKVTCSKPRYESQKIYSFIKLKTIFLNFYIKFSKVGERGLRLSGGEK